MLIIFNCINLTFNIISVNLFSVACLFKKLMVFNMGVIKAIHLSDECWNCCLFWQHILVLHTSFRNFAAEWRLFVRLRGKSIISGWIPHFIWDCYARLVEWKASFNPLKVSLSVWMVDFTEKARRIVQAIRTLLWINGMIENFKRIVLVEWLQVYIKRHACLLTLDFIGSRGGIPDIRRDRVVNPERLRDSADWAGYQYTFYSF